MQPKAKSRHKHQNRHFPESQIKQIQLQKREVKEHLLDISLDGASPTMILNHPIHPGRENAVPLPIPKCEHQSLTAHPFSKRKPSIH